MPDSLLLHLPATAPAVTPSRLRLPDIHDDALLTSASQRWRDSSQGLRELVVGIPAVRATLVQLLEAKLDLGEPDIGLQFSGTEQRPGQFVPIAQACAFVFQHPQVPGTLNAQCHVTGLPASHDLFNLTPQQLLERVRTLDPLQATETAWNQYWDARAPGAPVSRRERASQLYRDHLEATAHFAFAKGQLTAEQLRPLLALMDANAATPLLSTEQLSLVLSNGSKVKLPAAWVISFGGRQPVAQWLYLPLRPEAFKGFAQRSELEAWLSTQPLVPSGLSTSGLSFEYTDRNPPLSTGMTDLLAHLQQAQINALRHGSVGKADLAEQAGKALDQADQIDQQRSTAAVFASPPTVLADVADDEDDEASLFGNLYADIPWALRQAALKRQRDALETLQGTAHASTALQSVKDLNNTLETAEQAANKAATALLWRPQSVDLEVFNRELNALHQAHKAGLQTEVKLQQALEQLNSEECARVTALLDTPATADANHVAASLTLTMNEQSGDNPTTRTQSLYGPFVMTHPDALLDPMSPHSVLLFWPGIGGGLQKFANRQALDRQVFHIAEQDKALALQLTRLSGDPLLHALSQQVADFEAQAGAIRTRLVEATETAEREQQLDILRKRFLAALQVPVHAARSLALAHLLEQKHSSTLATNLPSWLSNLSTTDRIALKSDIGAFIQAMQRSHELLTLALEPRDDFTRKHLNARLRKDFSLKDDFTVTLDLPDGVTWEKRYSSGLTGTVTTTVMVASAKRSSMTLAELAQLNIDKEKSVQEDPLSQRLVFLRLYVVSANTRERNRLVNGINVTYLRKILPELDLPRAYERLILDAFTGAVSEAPFTREHRRECLIEPWRLMLKLQGRFARLQGHINNDELRTLEIAISADSASAWNTGGQRVVILPASLTVGGKDTLNQGPSTLSGVTFIEEQVSGVTLLYLPDSPDERFLRRYDNLESARKALFKLCQQDSMIRYLAGRAVQGNVRAHESRINDTVQKRFDALIGVGPRWPASTSFASHLLDAHMGRLLEAHRGTSRSNDALYMERYALKGPRAFNYLKMALGMLPFIGTAIALYDAWTAANQAVAAFLRGNVGDGLEEIKTMLLCLIDAAMDFIPGDAIAGGLTSNASALTRARQLRRLTRSAAAFHLPSQRQTRHLIARFAGYEYEKPISLSGLHPATHGLYRGIYRHTDGDFIVRQGRIFEVQYSRDSHHWRLSGNSKRTYKQPIALDEAGQWDTWFGVYGSTFGGGGLGGGNVPGHLANALDPYWPQVIRQYLPAWLTGHISRQRLRLKADADDMAAPVFTRLNESNDAIYRYRAATPAEQQLQRATLDATCEGDIEMALRHYEKLDTYRLLAERKNYSRTLEIQSEVASWLVDRYWHRALFNSQDVVTAAHRLDALQDVIDNLPAEMLAQRLKHFEEGRLIHIDILKKLIQMEELRDNVLHWNKSVVKKAHKEHVTRMIENIKEKQNDAILLRMRTSQRLEIIRRYDNVKDVSWFDLQEQSDELFNLFDRAMFNHHTLRTVEATVAQRSQILQNCLEVYTRFQRGMRIWTASYPQHFHLDEVPALMSGIEKMAERARKGIIDEPIKIPAGQPVPRIFTTADNQLLYGVERWHATTQRRQYVSTGRGGHEEIWEQGTDNQIRLLNPRSVEQPAPEQRSLAALLTDAQRRLDAQPAYHTKVQSYADQDMLPVELQHMMDTEATELTTRANRIEALDAQDPIIRQLRNKARELTATGRAMRTRQTLAIQKPTDGMLDDLMGEGVVEIRRSASLKYLGKFRGHHDHMQEYEIWTKQPQALLWYAHFHYRSATKSFRSFEKAHLKLREHRWLTHADNPDLPYADIGKQSTVLVHFEAAIARIEGAHAP
ncbi:hypothetical protein PSH79_21985 [Pseudomonas sp. FP2196]|uniref:dermonecrotic toxin domain-containing protein n=1 Tax=Pseudomonas sp. FP2196 TaxID=2954086 RepID=UPI0027373F37|nr:DUF6543 domain-containing protein [Pseudomonas sp. FP2196]WLH34573.1 hypothetical protein PSH79_21985 [Pseudomonas sp. FP2196]